MEREFVPYELAVRIKELGFNGPCFGYYWENLLHFQTTHTHPATMPNSTENCLAPTFSQAFRWFRKKYHLDSYVRHESPDVEPYYDFVINEDVYDVMTDTHEEAELACLDKLIEIVEAKSTQNANDGRAMEKLIESNRKFDEKNNNDVKYNPNDRNEDTPNITNFFI